ncbi:pyrolysin (pls), partial [Thermococci archaeon]
NDKKEVRLIIAPKDGYEMKVYEELKKMGKVDPMSKPEYKFIVITISTDKINELRNMDGILKIWLDKQVKIPKPIEDEVLEVTKPVKPNMFMSVYTINAYDAWMDYGVYGDNVTVAVLDTGIDPLQPFLQQTMDGKRKIIDWYDTTGEGYVDTSYNITNASVSNGVLTINQDVTVDWGTYYYLAGRSSRYSSIHINSVKIGNITSANGVYHFGLLPDRYFDMDFDQNFNEAHFVLIVNSSQYYDTVYVDTNDNLDLTDEQPIHIFHSTGDILKFGPGELSECLQYDVNHDLFGEIETICNATLGVVLTEIDPTGKYVNFGWDGGQHGTHVSGTIAGYGMAGTYFEGLYGVAPNAQLMAVRVLSSIGYGSTSWIINGMLYAAIYGPDWIPFSGDEADIISMSLGGLAGYNDGTESPENFYVNYLTELTEVVFSISAGNDGPSTNTVGSPGDADYAITVSNYWESDRWYLLYGFDVIDGPAMSSSRGPRMDGMFDPDVMAPGTDIFSSLPVWSIGDYGTPMSDYYSGTSMAAPHVSGTVALMIDYARQHNLNYDPFKIKEALELSAKKVDGSTMIDQGFGLIQADKAIAELEKLSDENSIVLYAGTTFTPFKNPIEKKLIPYAPINDYMSSMYDIPYLYRGVYLRNELPVTVPIYVYTFKYNQTEGQLDQITGTFQVSAGVNWIIPSVDEVNVGENGSMFYITIDYSRLQKSGTYVGLIYIDDPNTEYLEGYVPVIVYMPINKNGESEAKIIDTEKPGQAKHYYFSVPRGTQELEVTIKIPTDDEGSPLGRTKLVINDPTGSSAEYDGPYIGAGTSYIEYTYHIMKPNAGVWEITAYSSVSSSAYGISEDQYEINVKTYSITLEPSLINKDFDTPGIKEIKATAINSHSDLNVSVLGVGVGKLDVTYPRVENVSQDFIKLVNIIESNESLYYMNVGITQPEDPNADLDLYVWYYETLDQLLNDLNDGIIDNYTNQYVNQIGPTSEEHLELFMPPYGYYLIGVHGYDTAGLNPIHFIYYEQILNDNGDVIVNTTPFEFKSGDTKTITANVNLSEEGTYLGVLGIKDSESGATLTYAPMILQVGQPEMYVALMGTAIIGEPSTLTLQILDMATLEPIQGETNVVINDQVYYAVDGELKFTYTPLSLGELKFNVTV